MSEVDEWTYEPVADLDQGLAERMRSFPREPHIWVHALRLLAAATLRLWLRVYHRLTVRGREHLPRGESFVLIANHSSHLDAPTLTSALPLRRVHRVFAAAAADYFFDSLPRSALASIVMNAMPFDRGRRAPESLALCRALLAKPGNVLILFPEGTRNPDGMRAFRRGIGRLIEGTTVPVVPCFIDGAARALPKGALVPRPVRLSVQVGAPRRYGELPAGRASVEAIVADLRGAVDELAAGPGASGRTH